MKKVRFQVPKEAGWTQLYKNRYDPKIGEYLDQALYALEVANPSKLQGLFQDFSFTF